MTTQSERVMDDYLKRLERSWEMSHRVNAKGSSRR